MRMKTVNEKKSHSIFIFTNPAGGCCLLRRPKSFKLHRIYQTNQRLLPRRFGFHLVGELKAPRRIRDSRNGWSELLKAMCVTFEDVK